MLFRTSHGFSIWLTDPIWLFTSHPIIFCFNDGRWFRVNRWCDRWWKHSNGKKIHNHVFHFLWNWLITAMLDVYWYHIIPLFIVFGTRIFAQSNRWRDRWMMYIFFEAFTATTSRLISTRNWNLIGLSKDKKIRLQYTSINRPR